MELTWMGRYRELVRSLVSFSNASNRSVIKASRGGQYGMTQHEYQILEYICEFENENRIMADIARDLGIAPSNVTKATKNLLQWGFIQKFRLGNNKKNIILKPTEAGKECYTRSYTDRVSNVFTRFFDSLEGMSEEELSRFEDAVKLLSEDWGKLSDIQNAEAKLTPIE